ncbi:hypothetical protein L1987_51606 [Smallanthus sonchifolius]|uniref:Uncharacterized protein n=1 Tax=Smallanthus sonchifolius TaxID=185202 RepID=A0ACB9ERD8_9ASTR|nr:hypothetical protein L1987_51606 [Smallanthus sonchifolius]
MSDNHNFVLKSVNCPYYCQKCGQLGFGKSYSCNKWHKCNLFYHKECEKPKFKVEHPFSKKCVLNFYPSSNTSGKCLCDVCGEGIKGYHYRCKCRFVTRHIHPFCLSYAPTLVALDGLTMNLMKVASTECLCCAKKDVCSEVRGWAYVSSCGDHCYHVVCVMKLVYENWEARKGACDPFRIIRERFPGDMNRKNDQKKKKTDHELRKKLAFTALSVIYNFLTGNLLGLIGDAINHFSDAKKKRLIYT